MKKIFSKFFTRSISHGRICIYSFRHVTTFPDKVGKIFPYYFRKLHSVSYPNIYHLYMKAHKIDINFHIFPFWSKKKIFFFHYFTRHFRFCESLILMRIDYERAHEGLSYAISLGINDTTWEALEHFSRFWIYLDIS